MSGPRSPNGGVIVNVFARTDVGRTREHNEDAFLVAELASGNSSLDDRLEQHVATGHGTLFMVADGMGGAAAGEIASAMAVETVLDELRTRWVSGDRTDPESFAAALKVATDVANSRIHRMAAEQPEYRGMGTTATIAGLLGDTLYVAQVGDSRAYLIRDGKARQITKDQSLMQRLIDAGEITEEEAEHSERRNIILQALGPEPSVRTEITHQQIRKGDALVLCSDGLSGLVRPDEIARIVTDERDLKIACKRLIDRANHNRGPANITVVIARFDGDALSSAAAGDAVGHQVFGTPNDATPTVPMEPFRRHSGTPPANRGIITSERPAFARVTTGEMAVVRKQRRTLVILLVIAALAAAAWVFRDRLTFGP
ncbi:MAG TPA: Stp1/IreP family PP2C-type Ser/Thr phosphatase [Gemmatimonadaceae bacterium]|nr:Stp1/IreP family PP2C-type Ser/Thr phosphatase [Gemmatimonadaceae bacterium]